VESWPFNPETQAAVVSQVGDLLIEEMRVNTNQQQKTITLQLHPAELGSVSVRLEWDGDGLRAHILTSEVRAGEMLNQNKSQLHAALTQYGYDVASLEVDHHPFQHQSDQHAEQQQRQSNAGLQSSDNVDAPAASKRALSAQSINYSTRSTGNAIDIMV
jgi:flagellar hook-length control protein FliK